MFKVVNHPLVRSIVVVISFIMLVGLVQSIASLWQKQDLVAGRRQVLVETEAEHTRLKDALAQATSSAFVERQAREKLGMVKPGETVVLMHTSTTQSTQELKNQELPPYWKQWMKLFF